MKKEFKDTWVAALRSGKYTQGTGSLLSCFGAKYCCLGVLCQINPDVAREGWEDGANLNYTEKSVYGLSHTQTEALVDMNDRQRLNFNQIADWIEENL